MFVLTLLLAFFVLTLNVATPWHTLHEENGLVFESAAINHIRYGLAFTKGQDYFDESTRLYTYSAGTIHPTGVSSDQQFQYLLTGQSRPVLYGHHPPLLGLTVAGSLLVFGYHFWSVRLVPITFTMLGLILFYSLMWLLFDPVTASLSAVLFISFPITAYYGRNVAHESPTLCCALGVALCYVLWRRSQRTRWLVAMAACMALGMAYGWPMLFCALILPALDWLAIRRVHWGLVAATVGAGTLIFLVVIAQISWASGWSLNALEDAFLLRSATVTPREAYAVSIPWPITILVRNAIDFGLWTLLLLPALWRFFVARVRTEGFSMRLQFIALFGLVGLTHILVFHVGAAVHDYWQFYLIPYYAASLGWGGSVLATTLAQRSSHATHRLSRRVRLQLSHRPHLLWKILPEAREEVYRGVWAAVFGVAVLIAGIPVTHQLYAGGSILQFPSGGPIVPLL
ncbi:MAG TPA: glycosyltransferase family 39 protein [Ktedonobacterales bacterium]